MQSRVSTICTFLLLCLFSLALPYPAPAAAAGGVWETEPTVVSNSKDLADLKYINTQNYLFETLAKGYIFVDPTDDKYTLGYDDQSHCYRSPASAMEDPGLATALEDISNLSINTIYKLRTVTIDDTDLLLAVATDGLIYTFPLNSDSPTTCPNITPVHYYPSSFSTLDVHRGLGLYVSLESNLPRFQLRFTVLELAADGYHNRKIDMYADDQSYEFELFKSFDVASLVSLGPDGDSVLVFLPSAKGITTFYGNIDDYDLEESYISYDTELETATSCFRMTRIGVSDPLSTTTTITLAVAYADNGYGWPAVYVVQVPVVEGVPQTLKVTASIVLEEGDSKLDFSLYGGMAYLDGSLVLATPHYVYNFMIPDPESSAPTLTLRSWFKSGLSPSFHDIDLLTPDVAVVGTRHGVPSASPVVLNLKESKIVQQPVGNLTRFELVNGLTGNALSSGPVTRLSDTSFITAGGNGAIRRWESCAGLGYDYTTALLQNIRENRAPYATCGCPDGKACLLGTAYTKCPALTIKVGDKCEPFGSIINVPSLSLTICPAGYYCNRTVQKGTCTGDKYSLEGAGECSTCPAGSYVTTTEGVNTACTKCTAGTFSDSGANLTCLPCPAPTYSDDGASNCFTCKAGHKLTANDDGNGTSCTVCPDGTYTETDDATECLTCPAGYMCKGGIKTRCANTETARFYQPKPAQTECLSCSDKNNYQYLIRATGTTCDYCPSTEYYTDEGCQPCEALTGTNYCETKTDKQNNKFNLLSSCTPDQWRVNPYECRDCQADETCHGDGTRTWKFKGTTDPDTASGKIMIAVIVVSLVILSALAFWLAYYLRHKGLSRRSAGANAKVETEVVGMIQL